VPPSSQSAAHPPYHRGLQLPRSTQGVDQHAISGLLRTLLEKDQPPARRIRRDKNRIGRVHRFSLRFRATS
jgi:hypothetical protein